MHVNAHMIVWHDDDEGRLQWGRFAVCPTLLLLLLLQVCCAAEPLAHDAQHEREEEDVEQSGDHNYAEQQISTSRTTPRHGMSMQGRGQRRESAADRQG